MYKITNTKKRLATAAADLLGNVIFLPNTLRRRRRGAAIDPARVRSILIVRTAYVGDVMMTLPMLAPLKRRFPEARIAFLASKGAAALLRNHPLIDEVIAFDAFWFHAGASAAEYRAFVRSFRKRRFDMVIEARGDIRDLLLLVRPLKARYKVAHDIGGGRYLLTHVVPYEWPLVHRVRFHLNIARHIGCDVDDAADAASWELRLTPEEHAAVQDILAKNGLGGPFIAAHPGGRTQLRRWPVERWPELYDRLMDAHELPLAIVGSPQEVELAETIAGRMARRPVVLAGKTSLRELAGVLGKASLMVCNDSGPMHIAAVMGTPIVAVVGPGKSSETGPRGVPCRVVERPCPYRMRCDESRCRNPDFHACMLGITAEQVLAAAADLVRELGGAESALRACGHK